MKLKGLAKDILLKKSLTKEYNIESRNLEFRPRIETPPWPTGKYKKILYKYLFEQIQISLKLTCHINRGNISSILKLSLCSHYSGWMSCLILFVWSSSSCEQREESAKFKRKYVLPPGIEPMTTCFPACRSNHSALGRSYCTRFLSRFVEILLPYFYCGSDEVEHVQTDDLFVLIVALRHSRGYTYFSHICTRLDLPSGFLAININNREVKHTNVYV